MKWFSVILVLFVALTAARAEGPDDQYVAIYSLIQDADSLNSSGQLGRALTRYREAQAALLRFQKDYPDWNTKVVGFRLNYLLGAIGALLPKVPPPAAPAGTDASRPGAAASAGAVQPGRPAPPPDWDAQVNTLKDQVRRLEEDKVSLEAKLKEALAAQPATMDPRELARAEEKIRSLLKENDLLKVSLDQARARPAGAGDPKALEEARQALVKANRDLAEQTRKANALEKERAALQIKLNNLAPSSWNAGAMASARKQLEIANRNLAEQTKLASDLAKEKEATMSRFKALKADSEAAEALRAENQLLKKQLADLQAAPASSSLPESARRQLAQAQTQIAALESDRQMLYLEKVALENKLRRLLAQSSDTTVVVPAARVEDPSRITKLEQERDELKQQLATSAQELSAARAATPVVPPPPSKAEDNKRIKKLERERDELKQQLEDSNRQLKSALAESAAASSPRAADARRIKKLEEERDGLKQQLELSNRELHSARALASAAPAAPTREEDPARMKKLARERDELKQQLEAATKELNSRRSRTAASHVLEMERQVATLQARLDVFEARQVPYTAEELALFRAPVARPVPVDSKPVVKATRELPPGTVALAAEARRYFDARQLDKAEDRYLQVLRQDQNHVPTLANLAAVELEQGQLALAETNILQALVLAPDDPSCLLVLGQLRFRQQQYDAALDALSRVAKAEPKNAEVQNFLGLTLSAKGLRGPAETALRKAIQLAPSYGEAHNNLAVIYATQKPPLLELARWHYQRALSASSPTNPDLEKLLNATNPAGSSR